MTEQGVSRFYANRSCGVTTAANVMYYMATHISGKSALYNQTGSLTKAKFNAFQKSVYEYLQNHRLPSYLCIASKGGELPKNKVASKNPIQSKEVSMKKKTSMLLPAR